MTLRWTRGRDATCDNQPMSTVCTDPAVDIDVQAELADLDTQFTRALRRIAEQGGQVDPEAAVAPFNASL